MYFFYTFLVQKTSKKLSTTLKETTDHSKQEATYAGPYTYKTLTELLTKQGIAQTALVSLPPAPLSSLQARVVKKKHKQKMHCATLMTD